MGCGTSFVKYVLFFFNLLVALASLALIGIGVSVLLNWAPLKDEVESYMKVAPWIFIVIGSIMFVIAFFGCCGAIRESHCMVVTYAIFLLVLIIVQVVIGVLLFTHGSTIKTELTKTIGKIFDKSQSGDKAATTLFNDIQTQFSCCGKEGPSDYGVVTNVFNLPSSCCSNKAAIGPDCQILNANRNGCSVTISDLYEKWNKVIAGVAIGIACVQVVGALFALVLANSIRNMDRRSRY